MPDARGQEVKIKVESDGRNVVFMFVGADGNLKPTSFFTCSVEASYRFIELIKKVTRDADAITNRKPVIATPAEIIPAASLMRP